MQYKIDTDVLKSEITDTIETARASRRELLDHMYKTKEWFKTEDLSEFLSHVDGKVRGKQRWTSTQ